MSCVLTFKIGNGEPIPGSHDGTLVTDDIDMNLMEFLKNTSEWESISQAIELLLRDKVGTYNQVSISDLTGEQGLIPNANVQFLQDQFPDIIFPAPTNLSIPSAKHLQNPPSNMRYRPPLP